MAINLSGTLKVTFYLQGFRERRPLSKIWKSLYSNLSPRGSGFFSIANIRLVML